MRIIALGHAIRQVAPMELALCLTVSLIAILSVAQAVGPSHALRARFISLAMAWPNEDPASPAARATDQALPSQSGLD
ncbi:hypothetical protein [Chelatococcus asaccharovorans]|uniref:Uncharacterized protein n=1 Tax=Chelatococcus asaccharovorans TaxID=28210 RepID=A0A2V3TV36_9HYPH|nr:hypothetical protein [Chelatococcus asaccharovorans]MBS7702614.1 hypothetical protein [Chelatococcus asaccharovorans]PXW52217.1 hypothetical protein C7450_11781 [Chelatococcus asaccharovorans]CAH1671915.1 conserved hypothetical protein [Chelatococcus asaccharovorans]CAH1676661.1 conserved hypothetical protein [Chelatococcus asaccharovorans]